MSAKEIIGPYFLKMKKGHAVTTNFERYVKTLDNFLISELHNFHKVWFQQNSEMSHTSNKFLPRVREIFVNKLTFWKEYYHKLAFTQSSFKLGKLFPVVVNVKFTTIY